MLGTREVAALNALAVDGTLPDITVYLRMEPDKALSRRLHASAPDRLETVSYTHLSTALYQAALLGGIEVTSRSAAVYPVGYCEMGQEAAVYDQGLDLVIENSTQMPLFLTARVYTENYAHYVDVYKRQEERRRARNDRSVSGIGRIADGER